MSATEGQQQIVVGYDGSAGANAALEWALDEAKLRGVGLRIVHAFPALVSYFGTTAHEHYPEAEADAREQFEKLLANAPSSDAVETVNVLVAGNPAEVLTEESAGAALLVVGSRGIGGLRGLVVGSVSMQCVSYAHCPVVVVRSDD